MEGNPFHALLLRSRRHRGTISGELLAADEAFVTTGRYDFPGPDAEANSDAKKESEAAAEDAES